MNSSDDHMKFAKRIYKYRKESGLTQKQLSKLMGISVPTLKKYETGEKIPDCAFLARFAILYRVSPDDVLNMNRNEMDKEIEKMFSDGENADDETKEKVSDMLKKLKGI